jgi:hypothetical protein
MSIAKIEKYIDDLERKLGKSIKILGKGDKLSYGDGVKLGRKANSMISTVKKAIKEYDVYHPNAQEASEAATDNTPQGTQPTDAETARILAKVEVLTATGEQQVTNLIATKPRFDALKVGGLIKLNLARFEKVSLELDKIVEEKAPAELKPKAAELNKRRQAALSKAVAAFANASGGEQDDGEDDSE